MVALKVLLRFSISSQSRPQVTNGFELYLCFSPLGTKAMAVSAVNRLLKWIRKEEDRLFILSPLTYWAPAAAGGPPDMNTDDLNLMDSVLTWRWVINSDSFNWVSGWICRFDCWHWWCKLNLDFNVWEDGSIMAQWNPKPRQIVSQRPRIHLIISLLICKW